MARAFTVAAAQFPVFAPNSWADVEAVIEHWVADAAGLGAELLLFPEYGGLALAHLDAAARGDLHGQIAAVQTHRDAWVQLHRRLARQYRVYLVAGSLPWTEGRRTLNRAWLLAPHGTAGHQDKVLMTPFEREQWRISGAARFALFDTELGSLAVNICYDAEFPLPARALCAAGAQVLLVPSCTDTLAGYHRVRIGAQARALENQCWVVQAALVGQAPWSPAIDSNVGRAGVFGPPDLGFPEDGVVALGPLNQPCWVTARIDPDTVARVRAEGAVRPLRDWPESSATAVTRAAL